jgi:hypothetical protein
VAAKIPGRKLGENVPVQSRIHNLIRASNSGVEWLTACRIPCGGGNVIPGHECWPIKRLLSKHGPAYGCGYCLLCVTVEDPRNKRCIWKSVIEKFP